MHKTPRQGGEMTTSRALTYPETPRKTVVDNYFGTKVEDPFRWLEDIQSDEVQKWVSEQAEFTETYLSETPRREELTERLKELFSLDAIGIPTPKNGRYFYRERKQGQDMAVLYVKDGIDGSPRVLIDPNTLSDDKSVVLKGTSTTEDGKLMAYKLSSAGNDKNSIHILDVDTGETLEDFIPEDLYPASNEGSVDWLRDKSGFYYERRPENVPEGEEKYHRKTYLHKLGTNYLEDELVVDPVDINPSAKMNDRPWVVFSKDQRYMITGIYFASEAPFRTELYLFDNENPEEGFVPIVRDVPETLFSAFFHRNRIYIETNQNAPNWKLCAVDVDKAHEGPDSWDVIIPEGESVLDDINVVKDKIFCVFLENVQSVLKEYDLDGNFVGTVEMPDAISMEQITCEDEGDEMFISYQSFAVPPVIVRMDLEDNSINTYRKMEAGFDVENLETKQIWYTSKDGTRVPMFVIHKKGLEQNGNNPTLLYGYGGFNISVTPGFMKTLVPLLENGGVVAIANLRGGGEFGEEWHKAGMRKNKQNVFDDFISSAEWLIANDYTKSEKLSIMGGSNGGLLVNVVANQRPDLFGAVISHVPVADMTRYQEFDGGRWWVNDYGCVEEEDMVEYLMGYSPYHNVVDGEQYPAILIATSDSDDRVNPMHSYKMAARLQEANASPNPILLRVEIKAGHSGSSAVSKQAETYGDVLSFVFEQLKVL